MDIDMNIFIVKTIITKALCGLACHVTGVQVVLFVVYLYPIEEFENDDRDFLRPVMGINTRGHNAGFIFVVP
jgi:hypothetical protein